MRAGAFVRAVVAVGQPSARSSVNGRGLTHDEWGLCFATRYTRLPLPIGCVAVHFILMVANEAEDHAWSCHWLPNHSVTTVKWPKFNLPTSKQITSI